MQAIKEDFSARSDSYREDLARQLVPLVGQDGVLWKTYELKLYEYDGSIDRQMPDVVVFPRNTRQVAEIVRFCNKNKLFYTARGAGTGLSGGSIPLYGGVLISFTRMTLIIEIDPENLTAVVEPGVVNLQLSQAAAPYGLYFVPDPSSQKSCTLGGNAAENSGGPHTLLYGVTTNHVLGLEVVTPDGEIRSFGGEGVPDSPGYDLCGLFVGSEGTMGLITRITVRLTPVSQGIKTFLAIFDKVSSCSDAVSGIIKAGIVPAALEMMDNLSIQAVEAASNAGYPLDAAALLLVELEGFAEELEQQARAIEEVCTGVGALSFVTARDAAEREKLWKGRKEAFGAIGRLCPEFYVCDGVVPRSALPVVLARIGEISRESGMRIANVFHAGDGNLHPLVMFDSQKPGDTEKAIAVGTEIIRVCAELGGTLSGEHGIGMEKRDMMCFVFNEGELEILRRVRNVFDIAGLCNPGKVLPTPGRCAEIDLPLPGRTRSHYLRDDIGQVW